MIALKNRRIGGCILRDTLHRYVFFHSFFILFFFHNYLNFVLYTYSDSHVHLVFAWNKLYSLIARHLSFAYIGMYAINIQVLHHSAFITVSFSRTYHHRLFTLSDCIKSTSSYNNPTYTIIYTLLAMMHTPLMLPRSYLHKRGTTSFA